MSRAPQVTPGNRGGYPPARFLAAATVVIEVLATAGFGAYIRFIMHDARLSLLVWFVGGLASLATSGIYFRIDATLHSLFAPVQESLRILDMYLRIQDPVFVRFKEDEIKALEHRLQNFINGEANFEGDAYYEWLSARLDDRLHSLRAISMRPESVYCDDVQESNWLKANISAAMRGVRVERIFVTTKGRLILSKNRKALAAHVFTPNMAGYVVWEDSLKEDVRRELGGGGLSIYDNDTVFWDQSYFAQNLSSINSPGIGQLVPRATLFRKPSVKVDYFGKVFAAVRSHVPSECVDDPLAGYRTLLNDLHQYCCQQYGSLAELALQADSRPASAQLVAEWKGILDELERCDGETAGAVMTTAPVRES